jgi:hypothetical protein
MKQQSKTPRPQQNSSGGRGPSPTPPAANSRVHSAQPGSSVEAKPAIDEVRRRAYEIYLDRQHTGQPGSPDTDWDQAERELRSRSNSR